MAAPFVTKDGEDANGVRAEVWVQTGSGTITSIEKMGEGEGKNAYITIESSLAQVKKPIKGWIDKSDPVYAKVVAAYEAKREIEYRMESQRKKGVARETPIQDLRCDANGKPDMGIAAQNTIMIFAAIDGDLTREAVTNPDEDPAAGGRVRATGATATKTPAPAAAPAAGAVFDKDAALTALATARATGMDDSVIGAAAAFALMAGATAKQVKDAGFTGQKATPRGEVRRVRAAEAPPHVAVNSDGRDNLGSYAVQAAFAAEGVATRLLSDAAQAAYEAHNAAVDAGEIEAEPMEAPSPINPGQALMIAKILLDIADHVQVGAYGSGRPDRMANSHTRARSLVFDAVKTRHPVPFGATVEERETWRQSIIEEEVERFRALVAASQDVAKIGEDEAVAEESAVESAPVAAVTEATRPQTTTARPKPPVEGEDGFEAPSAEVLGRFQSLVQAAGIEQAQNSPVQVYLDHKFGVRLVRKVHGPALETLIGWFERQADSGAKFREYVLREAGVEEQKTA